jgi:hypothetical protein
MKKIMRRAGALAVLATALSLGGCSGNVGMSVGVPIGNHGHISVGTGRWY